MAVVINVTLDMPQSRVGDTIMHATLDTINGVECLTSPIPNNYL